MDYVEGRTSWDVLESRRRSEILPSRCQWWTPQIVSGVTHKVKFDSRARAPSTQGQASMCTPQSSRLIDSVAPLLPRMLDGSQRLPKSIVSSNAELAITSRWRYILRSQEHPPITLEMEVDVYGRETD